MRTLSRAALSIAAAAMGLVIDDKIEVVENIV
jgi:hypothetical protein